MVDAETDRALPDLAPNKPKALFSDTAGIVSAAEKESQPQRPAPRSLT